ncbi:hypothetical protein PIB30_093201, partial [Stylosanthes scabra]|nr:hypothetical protein [Stylosanthes scabra]
MAFLLPNLQPSLLSQSKSIDKQVPLLFNHHHTTSSSTTKPTISFSSSCSAFAVSQVAQVNTPTTGSQEKQQQQPKDEFYVNLGLAVRTLREDMPLIFTKDLNYDIYRY